MSGIAPSEAKDAQEVYIEGRGFDAQPLTIKLIDSVTSEEWPIEGSKIRRIELNRVQVKLPDVGVQGRRLYYLRVNDNNVVNPAAEKLFIRQSDAFRPPDQRIRVQFIQWRPGWTCDYRSPPNDLEPVEPGPPYRCGCIQQPFLTERAVTRGLSSANPNDSWSATLWSDFENQWQDASREWSAVCSEGMGWCPSPGNGEGHQGGVGSAGYALQWRRSTS